MVDAPLLDQVRASVKALEQWQGELIIPWPISVRGAQFGTLMDTLPAGFNVVSLFDNPLYSYTETRAWLDVPPGITLEEIQRVLICGAISGGAKIEKNGTRTDKGSGHKVYRFQCQCGRLALTTTAAAKREKSLAKGDIRVDSQTANRKQSRGREGLAGPRRHGTAKPMMGEQTCEFGFLLKCDTSQAQPKYYIPIGPSSCGYHTGHIRLPEHLIPASLSELSSNDREALHNFAKAGLSGAAARNFQTVKTGRKRLFSTNQMRRLSVTEDLRSLFLEEIDDDPEFLRQAETMSTVELINAFMSKKEYLCSMLVQKGQEEHLGTGTCIW